MNQYPAKILEISHSTLMSYHSCPRKLEFAKMFGFNISGRSLAPEGGICLHKAFGAYLETGSKEQAVLCLMLSYPIDLCTNPLWNWSLEQVYAGLLALINWYDKNTHLELAAIADKKAIEVAFTINIIHKIDSLMPVTYRGYMDFIFYDRLANRYTVLDLKGTNANASDFTPTYKWDSQCLPYALILKRALDEELTHLDVQYLVIKLDLLEPKIQHLEFQKTEQDIREWTQDLLMDLTTLNTYIQTRWFPRRSKGCFNYNRKCRYFDICDSRNLSTINLMLASLNQPEREAFIPLITLDLEIN